jgi:hypothetical protein
MKTPINFEDLSETLFTTVVAGIRKPLVKKYGNTVTLFKN